MEPMFFFSVKICNKYANLKSSLIQPPSLQFHSK